MRRRDHRLFASPPVDHKDFTASGDGDIQEWIVIQPSKFNRSRRRSQLQLHQRTRKAISSRIKYEDQISTRSRHANGYIRKAIGSAKFSGAQSRHGAGEGYLLRSTKAAAAVPSQQVERAAFRSRQNIFSGIVVKVPDHQKVGGTGSAKTSTPGSSESGLYPCWRRT